MEKTEKKLFSQEMREVTRTIHNRSDALVNAKLGITLSDDSVWAEGLLVFYEIFKFLEEALHRHRDSLIGDLLLPGMTRTEAFEADLDFYLGANWRDDYRVRPEVQQYLDHLRQIEEENPYLIIAYVYHLYMGLFSGGQILMAKRVVSLTSCEGCAVTTYDGQAIGPLKKKLREAINMLADNLDEDTRKAILQEGIKVFELNNLVISSVRGVNEVLKRRGFKLLIFLLLLGAFLLVVSSTLSSGDRRESRPDQSIHHDSTSEL